MAEPAVYGIKSRQRDAGDRGRPGERKIDDRVQYPPSRESVAHEYPGHDDAHYGVNRRGVEGGHEA